MASTAPRSEEPKLSPRETRLVSVMKQARGAWVSSEQLCLKEYGTEAKWPLNARMIITTTMRSLGAKLSFHDARIKLNKRGGGRSGNEYRLEKTI